MHFHFMEQDHEADVSLLENCEMILAIEIDLRLLNESFNLIKYGAISAVLIMWQQINEERDENNFI
jgi:hypothetical protein